VQALTEEIRRRAGDGSRLILERPGAAPSVATIEMDLGVITERRPKHCFQGNASLAAPRFQPSGASPPTRSLPGGPARGHRVIQGPVPGSTRTFWSQGRAPAQPPDRGMAEAGPSHHRGIALGRVPTCHAFLDDALVTGNDQCHPDLAPARAAITGSAGR
jgi:hypothetical protein